MADRKKIKDQPLNIIRNNNYSESLIIEEDHEIENSAGGSGSDVEYIGVGDGRKNDESQVALDEDGDNLDESQDNSYVHEKEDVEEVDAPPATWKEKIKRAACACRKRKVYYSRTIELQLGKANVVTDETKLAQNVIRNQKYK
jgi:hypothetical protein